VGELGWGITVQRTEGSLGVEGAGGGGKGGGICKDYVEKGGLGLKVGEEGCAYL